MTTLEQDRAIAAVCGYDWYHQIPSFTTDLNAMHEAENMIQGRSDWNKYTDKLGKLRHYKPEIHCARSFANIIVHATAQERAEAFLRTLGKWK